MLDESRVGEIIYEICENPVPKRSGGFNARCPVCGDSQKSSRIRRLHVNWYQKYNSWVATCYNGGCPFRSGDIYSLYATVKGISYFESKKIINQEKYDVDAIKKRLSKTKEKPIIVDDDVKGVLDLDMNDILTVDSVTDDRIDNRYIEALKSFIHNRKINHPVYVAKSGKYKGRIIIPVFINGEMVYFQGRSMFANIEPKYLNPVVDKTDIIMNCDKFDRSKSIIVTEGIIDSWMVEDNQGTTILGSYFSDDIIECIKGMTDDDVILCFDNPFIDNAGRKEFDKFTKESRFNKSVKYFLPNRKDFKDLNELRMIYDGSIYDYVINNSYSMLNATIRLTLNV